MDRGLSPQDVADRFGALMQVSARYRRELSQLAAVEEPLTEATVRQLSRLLEATPNDTKNQRFLRGPASLRQAGPGRSPSRSR